MDGDAKKPNVRKGKIVNSGYDGISVARSAVFFTNLHRQKATLSATNL